MEIQDPSFYEKQIKRKIREKGDQRISEKAHLLKIFKFFDLNNSGTADLRSFTKSLAKVGLVFSTEEEILELFKTYDTNNTNSINYKDFVDYLYQKPNNDDNQSTVSRRQELETQSNIQQRRDFDNQSLHSYTSHINIQKVPDLCNKLKKEIFRKKLGLNLIYLGLCLKQFNLNTKKINEKKEFVSQNEFIAACKRLALNVNVYDVQKIFEHLDQGMEIGYVEINELMDLFKASFNSQQQNQIFQIFDSIKSQSQLINHRDLLDCINYERVAEIMNEDMQQIHKDIFGCLQEFNYLFKCGYQNMLSVDEFLEFFRYLAGGFTDNSMIDSFLNVVTSKGQPTKNHQINFNQPEQHQYKQQQHQQQYQIENSSELVEDQETNRQFELVTYRIKNIINKRGTRGYIGFLKMMFQMDVMKEQRLNVNQFKRVLKETRLDLTNQEIATIFQVYGQNSYLDYNQFFNHLTTNYNQQRQNLVKQIFSIIDNGNNKIVNINQILNNINARNHPDVKNNKKSYDEVLNEFKETLQYHQQLKGHQMNSQFDQQEFLDYFRFMSASINEDQFFEYLLSSVFRIYSHMNINQNKNQSAGLNTIQSNIQQQNYFYNKKYEQKPSNLQMETPFGISPEKSEYNKSECNQSVYSQQSKQVNSFGDKTVSTSNHLQNKPLHVQQKMYNVNNQRLVQQFQRMIKQRGVRGFVSLQRLFSIIDKSNRGEISLAKFQKILNDLQFELSQQDSQSLFEIFTPPRMNLSFPLFMSVIRGEMSESRRSIVKKAYDRLARGGPATLRNLFENYQYENHPYVLADEMEVQEAIEEFQENIQIMIGNQEGDLDVCVSWEQFIEFYRNYSATIEDEEEFVDIVTLTWDLAKEVAYTSEDMKQDFRSRFY